MDKKIKILINGIEDKKSEEEMEKIYEEAIKILSEKDTKGKLLKLSEISKKINDEENSIVENAKNDDVYLNVKFSGDGLKIKEKIEWQIYNITVRIEKEEIEEEKKKYNINKG